MRRTPNTSCGLVNETSWLTWVWDLGGCGDMCLSSQPGSPPFWPSLVYHLHLRGAPLHSTYSKSSQNLCGSPLFWSPKQSTGLSTCQGTCPHLPGSGQWPPQLCNCLPHMFNLFYWVLVRGKIHCPVQCACGQWHRHQWVLE